MPLGGQVLAGMMTVDKCAFNPQLVTAGAGIDGTATAGDIIDRFAVVSSGDIFTAAKWSVFGKTTLASSVTFTLTVLIEHGNASNMSDAAAYTYSPTGAAVGLTATLIATGAQTALIYERGGVIDLSGAKRYIRMTVTVNMSSASTDTTTIAGEFTFCGGALAPAA